MKNIVILSTIFAISLTACQRDQAASTASAETPPGTPAELVSEPGPAADDVDSGHELAGTSWQLVEIASMDDSVTRPDDPAKYSLSFGADGSAAIVADCNRGTGSWEGGNSAQLEFGPIAATMAMCPPESISDQYLKQFQWIRSYVLEDGHLYLATMADGAIIEFSPLP